MRPRHVHAAARQSLRELVAERLCLLEPRARTLVRCAALLGYRIDAPVLAACAGTTLDETFEALRLACDLDLVVAESARAGRYRFRHNLTQSAIRDALCIESERTLHAAIASALERLPDADARLEQLAYHWLSAGDDAQALAYNRRAAEQALRLGARYDELEGGSP